jgi:predicted ABC-type ATPase
MIRRLRESGPGLVKKYIAANTAGSITNIARDAAKEMFPEYQQNRTLHNRHSDAAASALADAARRYLLSRQAPPERNRILILTGAPASGKTASSGPEQGQTIEIVHETILSSLDRASELVDQALIAGRVPIVRLFYTDDPRINVQRMIDRARAIGRTVPIEYMAKMYVRVPLIVQALKARFNAQLTLLVTNNSETPQHAVPHNDIVRALYHVNRYNERECLEIMDAQLSEIRAGSNPIPDAIFHEARLGLS